MSDRTPIAVFCADLHLSTRTPAWRGEEDFGELCASKLRQILSYAAEATAPVFIAGDVFDKARDHNALHLLLRLAGEFGHCAGGRMFAVKGQHDMVAHNETERSAFDNALAAGALRPVDGWLLADRKAQHVAVSGCGWCDPVPEPDPLANTNILLIHRTYWQGSPLYPGQTEGNAEKALAGDLKGFDIVFSGDNHIPFEIKSGGRSLWNCGAVCRRSIAQKAHAPSFCVLYDDLSVCRVPIGTDAVWLEEQQAERKRHAEAGLGFADSLAGGDFRSQGSYLELLAEEGRARQGTDAGQMLLKLSAGRGET